MHSADGRLSLPDFAVTIPGLTQLVPAAGYELDTFRISGFPRRPGLALLRALWQAAAAPFACRQIVAQVNDHCHTTRRRCARAGAGGIPR